MSSNLYLHNNKSSDLYLWILKSILQKKSSEICTYLLRSIFAKNYVKLIKFIINQKQKEFFFGGKKYEQSNKLTHIINLIVDERLKT
jgi:hypothetical protein